MTPNPGGLHLRSVLRAMAAAGATAFSFFIACGSVASMPAPDRGAGSTTARRSSSGRISINFASIDVRLALSAIAEYARTEVLVTPGATGVVSVNLRNRTADEAITLVAAAAGLSVARPMQTYVVGPPEEVRKATSELGSREVAPLSHLAPTDAKDVAAKLSPHVSFDVAGKSLVLSGLADDLAEARASIARLDLRPPDPAPERTDTRVIMVQRGEPATVERVLQQGYPSVRIVRQERALILTGTASVLARVEASMKDVDTAAPTPVEVRETAVIELKYLNARRAEETLRKALPALTITAGPEPSAPPAAQFQPLAIGILGGSGFLSQGGGASAAGGVSNPDIQPLSRSTRLIISGPKAEVEAARRLITETDVAPAVVYIQAKLIEVNRNDSQALGLEWDFSSLAPKFTIPSGNDVRFGVIQRSDASFNVALKALCDDQKARVLANPSISVVDSEDASIFIGQLLRFKGGTVVTPSSGTIQTTETTPVGIALLVRPRIHPSGEVTLKVHPVVSNVTSFVDGLPQTSSREADTTVRLKPGEKLVIGGLDREEETGGMRKVPILGDLPVVGELFRRRESRKQATEVVVVLQVSPVIPAPESIMKSGYK